MDPRNRDLENYLSPAQAETFIPLFERLQSSSLTLAEARIFFDDVLHDFPETQRWLAEDGSIVRNPDF